MTTMTRGKKLFVLLLALVILTGVTLLVAHLVPDEDESTAEDTSYIIFSLDPDQVTQLSWTYEDSTVTLTKDEVAAALEAAGLAVTGRREKNGWIALEARLG